MSSSSGDSSRPISPSSRSGLTRRRLVAGAAWAAPAVAASTLVPAFAASPEEGECTGPYEDSTLITAGDGVKKVAVLTVPAGARRMRFTVIGGAGGTNYAVADAGSGALVEGSMPVRGGQVITLTAGSGGIGNGELTPAEGGDGYGVGGSSKASSPVPADVVAAIESLTGRTGGVMGHGGMNAVLYSSSGGGSSAIEVDGVPMIVAGGGGGAGTLATYATDLPSPAKPGALQATAYYSLDSSGGRHQFSTGGGAGSSDGDGSPGFVGFTSYTAQSVPLLKVNPGSGAMNGMGGGGGEKLDPPTSDGSVIGFSSTSTQKLVSSAAAGETGPSGFRAKGADGVVSYSYQRDQTPAGTDASPSNAGAMFNGYQSVVSGGGGAGYGGGGSGAALSVSARVVSQKWNNDPARSRYAVGTVQLAGGGAGGGTYMDTTAYVSDLGWAMNAPSASGERGAGSVEVAFCF
ncbi:phosphoenolpyruvate synthase [Rothia mucilaginosa]|uniref:phosphoenolpyruvate synthase n=1 Tax=Rothia mucilaginosa TaxID=43675 RepID=UPI0027BAB782|nr:phosphoenolpyruvate synthase [Rothia mucilaginosa]